MDVTETQTDYGTAASRLAEAKSALTSGDHGRAEARFRSLIGTALQAEGYYGLGFLAKAGKDDRHARTYFDRAVEFDPLHANSHFQLGTLDEADGWPEQAIDDYLRALAANPAHHGARRALARLGRPIPDVDRKDPSPGPSWASEPLPWEPVGPSGYPNQRPLPDAARIDDIIAPPRPLTRQDLGHPAEWIADTAKGTFGVYEYLVRDRSLLSQQAVAVLRRLDIDRSPTAFSFFGYVGPTFSGTKKNAINGLNFVLMLLVLSFLGIAFVQWIGTSNQPAGPLPNPARVFRDIAPTLLQVARTVLPLVVLAAIFIPLVRLLRHATTRLRVQRGRLQVERGLLNRKLESIELWRVQNIELERRGFQLLTGDGTLVVHAVSGAEPLRVTGIARGRRLNMLHRELLDLVFLLRTNPSIKGIVQ